MACEWGDSPRRAWGKIASMTLPQRINRYLRSASAGFFHPQEMSPDSGKVKYKKHSWGPPLVTIDYIGPLSLSGNTYSLSPILKGVKVTGVGVFIKPQ